MWFFHIILHLISLTFVISARCDQSIHTLSVNAVNTMRSHWKSKVTIFRGGWQEFDYRFPKIKSSESQIGIQTQHTYKRTRSPQSSLKSPKRIDRKTSAKHFTKKPQAPNTNEWERKQRSKCEIEMQIERENHVSEPCENWINRGNSKCKIPCTSKYMEQFLFIVQLNE